MICKHCGVEFYDDDRPGQQKPGFVNECYRCGVDHVGRVSGYMTPFGAKGTDLRIAILAPGEKPPKRNRHGVV
jgi:NAD-dependent SIR2 family protein deacetylase